MITEIHGKTGLLAVVIGNLGFHRSLLSPRVRDSHEKAVADMLDLCKNSTAEAVSPERAAKYGVAFHNALDQFFHPEG